MEYVLCSVHNIKFVLSKLEARISTLAGVTEMSTAFLVTFWDQHDPRKRFVPNHDVSINHQGYHLQLPKTSISVLPLKCEVLSYSWSPWRFF